MLEKTFDRCEESKQESVTFIKNISIMLECSVETIWISDKVCSIAPSSYPLVILFYAPCAKRVSFDHPMGRDVVHVDQDIWLTNPKALLDRIVTLAGKGTRIYGRETVVARVDKKMALDFQQEHHLQVALPGKYRYGLFKEGELLSLAVFSGLRNMSHTAHYRSIELLRFCHKGQNIVVGGMGKILSAMVHDFAPNDIMTYLDRDWSSGEKFEKLGFLKKGITKPQAFKVRKSDFKRIAIKEGEINVDLKDDYYVVMNSGSIKMIKEYPL